jgi:hypothetical protein
VGSGAPKPSGCSTEAAGGVRAFILGTETGGEARKLVY